MEPVIDNFGQRIAQEIIVARGVQYHLFDFGFGGLNRLAREDCHTDVKNAPCWHRAGPVAPLKFANIKIQGMVHMGVFTGAFLRGIPAMFHLVQSVDQRNGSFDRIRTAAGIGHVGGEAF